MGGRPYHNRFHSDMLTSTMGLDLEERGAFATIMDLIYDQGGPIPWKDNPRFLQVWLGVSPQRTRKLVDKLVDKSKIYITEEGEISQNRCEFELEKANIFSRKQSENARKPRKKSQKRSDKSNKINGNPEPSLDFGTSQTVARARDSIPITNNKKGNRRANGSARQRVNARASPAPPAEGVRPDPDTEKAMLRYLRGGEKPPHRSWSESVAEALVKAGVTSWEEVEAADLSIKARRRQNAE